MHGAYYNELDPYAAQWLRNLIAAGHIAPGDVDERDIRLVRPDDLRGYRQCHFFAGIGVWSYALRKAGWPDDEEVWTGSCPCQPFSAAGLGAGFEDPRHLWPSWGALIYECRPGECFGEQIADKDGRAWLDLVQADMEEWGYAFAPVVLPAAGFGAPHPRHRIFFVAESVREPSERRTGSVPRKKAASCSERLENGHLDYGPANGGEAGDVGDATGGGRARCNWAEIAEQGPGAGRPVSGFWAGAEWIPCRDGKHRPVEPGTFPLAHGTPARVGRLRAYGNAIVAPVAAEFIRAYREVR